MPDTLRVATFNCENLFRRPKIFNESQADARELLEAVADLEEELRKDVFDKPKIAALEKKLKGFAHVVDIRGGHASKSVTGAKDWIGWVELYRERYTAAAIENTARVIRDLDADVVCLIEVEDRLTLREFHDRVLVQEFLNPINRKGYRHLLLLDGNDQRGIDVSLATNLDVEWMRSHAHERTTYMGNDVATFSRDCLVVRLKAPDGKPLTILVNHLKSMGYSPESDPLSNKRRLGQSKRVAELVDLHDLQNEYVVVAGDLNSEPDSPSLEPLVNKQGLFNVNLKLDPDQRGTYRTGKQQLDYLLVSDPLRDKLKSVHVERCGIYTKTRPHYPEVKGMRDQASDHGAVVAEFTM
jgi:endonuclease/exonuclease/phosphatase family metal-dependent hydrolase